MNEYIELMEHTLSEWVKEYPIEWIELAYKNTVGEPTTQERQAESGKFDTAFQDGYDHGYAQARFDYEQEPRKGHCKDCKWWKDNNGTYRRGVKAESQCPINRKEVYEGNGYCFLYEPQESEDT